ncbi:hypothetical protein, partial [Xanthomonas campestris]|uniref:hypothetical protein n=1 Tax=Xanthomonas campestris TaxID=339 RepID=UPI0032E3EAF0
RLFFMSVLVVDGLYSFTWYGSAGAGQAFSQHRSHRLQIGKSSTAITSLLSREFGFWATFHGTSF